MKFLMILMLFFSLMAQSKGLVLNGKGMRLATIFKIKVYESELYTQVTSQDPQKIISQKGMKRIVMNFLRDVGKKKIVKGFEEGLKKNDLKNIFSPIFDSLKDIKKGDKFYFEFFEDNIDFTLNNGKTIRVKNENASRYLLLWLGKVPNQELRKGLLGVK